MRALGISLCVTVLLRTMSWMMQPKRSAQYYAAMRLLEEPDEAFTSFSSFQTPQDVFIGIALFMLVLSIVQMVKNCVIVSGLTKVHRKEE